MRIAYVSADPGVPVLGQKGCSIHVQEILRAFSQLGAQIDLFSPRITGTPPADLASVRLHPLPLVKAADTLSREENAYALNKHLRSALREAGSFDMVYERYSLWNFSGMEFAREAGIPGILEVNAPLVEEQARYRELLNRNLAEEVCRQVFSAATHLLAVSDKMADYLRHFTAASGKIHVVPNGVNPARFPRRLQPLSPKPDCFTIGFLGTLKAWHGLPYLIDAFADFRHIVGNSRLLIVGDGPERDSLQERLRQHNCLELAEFTGAVHPDQVPGWLASMNVAVAPYPANPDFYFSPLKVYEYMAACLPVVASRIGQLSGLINHQENGLLVRPADPAELTRKLFQLWKDPMLCRKLGDTARRNVVDHHSWVQIGSQILHLANPLLLRQAAH